LNSGRHSPDGAGQTLLSEQVYEGLKQEIIECRLEPGAVIAEASIARRYGVSKGPVREALKRLVHLGLVRSVPRVGHIVTSVNLADIDEIYLMRMALEPVATELATPRLTEDQLDELERIARILPETSDQSPETRGKTCARANDDFHRAIAHASGVRRLEATIGRLLEELERVLYLLAYDPALERVIDQHGLLVDTLRTRKKEKAGALMRSQLETDYEVVRGVALSSQGARSVALRGSTLGLAGR
jgi:DNA-binding GntR family transcriptional regulator